eukprot:364556-Chlamydomonas_euryale.AAC.1
MLPRCHAAQASVATVGRRGRLVWPPRQDRAGGPPSGSEARTNVGLLFGTAAPSRPAQLPCRRGLANHLPAALCAANGPLPRTRAHTA